MEFENPFEFFELPFVLQYEYLLKSDLQSIKNLCNAAALSNKSGAVSFFRELCNNFLFWKEKLRRDFVELFEETSREAEEKGMEGQVGYWRGKYEEEMVAAQKGLIEALKNDDIETFREYLRSGVDPNTRMGVWLELKGPVQKESKARGWVKHDTIERPVLTYASQEGKTEFV